MGCCGGKAASSANGLDLGQKLLDFYSLGDVLGQGAFGIVYACTKKDGKDFKYAVKMVDKYESASADIQREADLMMHLDHPNLVKLHAVYHEKCFVCFVMDRFDGGDLITGMQLHWQNRGEIPCESILHLLLQMAAGIVYLHGRETIHRDVKGDNFLTSVDDIRDTDCKVVMSDFGTALTLTSANDRLRHPCGTMAYWAPEFHKLNYSLKVDVWAFGVIIYGMVEGTFPFKDHGDVLLRAPRLSEKIPEGCRDFIKKLLTKDEDVRPSSAEAVEHPWLAQGLAVAPASAHVGTGDHDGTIPNKDAKTFKPKVRFREDAVVGATDERRQELVERLTYVEQKKTGTLVQTAIWSPKFGVTNHRQKKTTIYEWCPKAEADEILGKVSEDAVAADTVEVAVVEKMLRSHGIDVSLFGKDEAKSLQEFAHELQIGSACLLLDASAHKKLVRVVDVVLLKVVCNGRLLMEVGSTLSDGRKREHVEKRLPATKKEPHENLRTAVDRICSKEINIPVEKLMMNFEHVEVYEERVDSVSYPGVTTVYRKELVTATATKDVQGRGGFTHVHKESGTSVEYKWMSKRDCEVLGLVVSAPHAAEISALIASPVGMRLEELKAFLTNNRIDLSKFGQDGASSLEDLSDELVKGEAHLTVSHGEVTRLVDLVVLYITKEQDDKVLVEMQEKLNDGTVRKLNLLPALRRRPDENIFKAAQKLLNRQLHASENSVTICAESVLRSEESKPSASYPMLKNVYRRGIIKAQLHRSQE